MGLHHIPELVLLSYFLSVSKHSRLVAVGNHASSQNAVV